MRRDSFLSAIKFLALLLLFAAGSVQAAPAGQVINLSGPLFAMNTEGVRRVLSIGSHVEPGETLITEEKTYAQVRFIDKGVITLRPGTQFKIESFAFDEKAPEKDGAVFGLLKGALRSVTGLVGKRGNQDAYRMNTATATIGIRGTDYIATYVPAEEAAVSRAPYALPLLAALDLSWTGDTMSDVPAGGLIDSAAIQPFLLAQAGPPAIIPGGTGLSPGLYVQVLGGQIQLSNGGGTQLFSAGQFGFTGSFTQPPVIVPANPGIQFTPPPTFQQTQQQGQQAPAGQLQTPPGQQQQQNQQGEGCIVR